MKRTRPLNMKATTIATYRLQFNPGFRFEDAGKIISYLCNLGISDIYSSPIFQATPDSTHGYDVVDPNRINHELGGMPGFKAVNDRARRHGLGWIQDIVPNHTAFSGDNVMLMDVFEQGMVSTFRDFFDIDWQAGERKKVLAPFLGSSCVDCLAKGEITLDWSVDGLSINYYSLKFPVKLSSYHTVFAGCADKIGAMQGSNTGAGNVGERVLAILKPFLSSRQKKTLTLKKIRWVKRQLWDEYQKSPDLREYIDCCLTRYRKQKSDSDVRQLWEQLLDEQVYRLVCWRQADEDIDYRRFFTINGLISMRVEKASVFDHTHDLICRMVKSKAFTGVRVDHIDGLYEPAKYLSRLVKKLGMNRIWVEKILAVDELLPESWPIRGTTGYDFLNAVNGVFCCQPNEKSFSRLYHELTSCLEECGAIAMTQKRLFLNQQMAGDLKLLLRRLRQCLSDKRNEDDPSDRDLTRALKEILIHFPVYRTYIETYPVSACDREILQSTLSQVGKMSPELMPALTVIKRCLLGEDKEKISARLSRARRQFIKRFQQLSGPVMAKGFEDTTLYRYNRLLALNEVGGEPHSFGWDLAEFHRFNLDRGEQWPDTMNATATHDTKRGEDMRARLHVLSEIPAEWRQQVLAWKTLNREIKTRIATQLFPDDNMEYFIYQSLLGAWPFVSLEADNFVERMQNYLIKAARESQAFTTWTSPNQDYEAALKRFVTGILSAATGNHFLPAFLPLQQKIAFYGAYNSLSQTLIKVTAPGIPDIYQGTEYWDLSLVDPDNRRPVDYPARIYTLNDMLKREQSDLTPLLRELQAQWQDGRIKQFLLHRSLQARREYGTLFQRGDYLPLKVSGTHADHVIAFARRWLSDGWAITIVPRFLTNLIKVGKAPLTRAVWGDTWVMLPSAAPGQWRNSITNEIHTCSRRISIGEVLNQYPVALLKDYQK